MLDRAFLFLARVSPKARTNLWKLWYNFLGARYRQKNWTFMNYGYSPLSEDEAIDLPKRLEADRYCAQLYHHVASQVPLRGKRVIEVGSGRGGGARYVHETFGAKQTRGFDFSSTAVRFCRSQHKVEGLSFKEGDAGELPLKDSLVNAVVNVESSHCYPDRKRFFSEVFRVLKPGGHFLYADFFDEEERKQVSRWLLEVGFEVVQRTDITPNVLRAMDLDHDRKLRQIDETLNFLLAKPFKKFAGLKDSPIYDSFKDRELIYESFALQKPG